MLRIILALILAAVLAGATFAQTRVMPILIVPVGGACTTCV